jgi:hypothetical protein
MTFCYRLVWRSTPLSRAAARLSPTVVDSWKESENASCLVESALVILNDSWHLKDYYVRQRATCLHAPR